MNGHNTKPLIVFDLVATLTDAGPRYAVAFQEVAERFGIKPPPQEEILSALGNKNLKQITEEYAGDLDEVQQKDFMNACNQTCDSKLYDVHWHEDLHKNVRKTIQTLHGQGYKLGIYTGTREDALEAQLRYHNIEKYFDFRFVRAKNNERDGFAKCNDLKRDQLADIIKKFREEASAPVIVVGDSHADYEAASALGLSFIGFAANDNNRQKLQSVGAKRFIADFDELPGLLKQQFSCDHRPGPSGMKPA